MTSTQAVRHYAQQLAQPHPHGKKRAADSSLETEQRLSKRFDLLNLVDTNGTRLYIPVPGSHDAGLSSTPTPSKPKPLTPLKPKKHTRLPHFPPRAPPSSTTPSTSTTPTPMHLDDTPHTTYIHDLAAELSDLSSDEETPIFLPDIEKHLARIPKQVLLRDEQEEELKATRENALVVYGVPSSLSVAGEVDGVRRAIEEVRERIRGRLERGDINVGREARSGDGERKEETMEVETEGGRADAFHTYDDGDAMDID